MSSCRMISAHVKSENGKMSRATPFFAFTTVKITHFTSAYTLICDQVYYIIGRILTKSNRQDGFLRILSLIFEYSTKNVGVWN